MAAVKKEGLRTYLPCYNKGVCQGHEGSLRPLLVHPLMPSRIADQRTNVPGPETGTMAAYSRCLTEEIDR